MFFWLVGLYAYLKRKGSNSAKLLFLLSCCILLALVASFACTRGVPTTVALQAVVWLWAPALFVDLFLWFPERVERRGLALWFGRAVYFWAAAATVFYFALGYRDEILYPYFRTFLLLNLTIGLLLGAVALVHTWLSSRQARIKQQTKIVAVGTIVGIIPFLALSTLPEAFMGKTLVAPEITILTVLLMPLTIAYSIVKHRLLDIDLVIKRGIIYGSMTSAAIVVFFVLMAVLGIFWHSLVDFERVGIALGMSAGAAVLFGPVKERLDVVVDRTFYKDRYDYNKRVKELSSAIAELSDTEEISRFAVGAAVDTLNLDGACLYTRDGPGVFSKAAIAGIFEDKVEQQDLASVLPVLTPQAEFPNTASAFHPGVSFFVPLVANDGEVGVLCLGSKVSRQQFSVDDTYLLHDFAPVVATALRNATLLKEIGTRDAELKVAYDNLRESEGQYRALVEAGDQMGVAIVLLQNTDKLEAAHVFANEEWARMTGYSIETLKSKSHLDLIHPLYRDAVAARVRQALQGRETPGRYEIYILGKDGSETPVEVTGAPVTYMGRPAVVSYLRNITDRKQAEARLREMATRDYLTGLWNHREFQERLPSEIARAQRSDEHFSLLFLDIDHFKAVNDRFGHQMGDEILQMVGRFLKDALRTSDIACRYGGDEFAIILPNTDVEHTRALVARIQDSFNELRKREVLLQMLEFQPGLSMGIAGYPEDAIDAQELLRKANQAMFYSKSLGGDRAQIWGEAMKEFEAEPEKLRGLLRQANLDTALALAGAIDARDAHTLGHSKRVSELAVAVAVRMGLGEAEVEGIRVSGLLHDVGKIGLPDALLHKRTILTEEEFLLMKRHVDLGVKMLSGLDYMKDKLDIIGGHHENWDGTGYPVGLSGKDIALGARIIRVVDTYDAMVTDRPYRRHIGQEQALIEIDGLSGKTFDPAVVTALQAVVKAR